MDSAPLVSPPAVILINIGSPDAPEPWPVYRYLCRFLTDRRILGMPWVLRQLLVRFVIAPLRARASAHAYRQIWTPEGSPLTVYGRRLAAQTGATFATCYGTPSIHEALDQALDPVEHVGPEPRTITVLPLFPQYAGATVASVQDAVDAWLGSLAAPRVSVSLRVLPPFWSHPAWIASIAARARPLIDEMEPDAVLFSYHGLPESQVRADCPRASADLHGGEGAPAPACCAEAASRGDVPARCYRAQCVATTTMLGAALGLAEPLTSFQSRFGPARWIGPSTEDALRTLPARGVRRLVVVCPSFVADCLETLEEIGIRGRDTFLAAGGEAFAVAPCPNDDASWCRAVLEDATGAPA